MGKGESRPMSWSRELMERLIDLYRSFPFLYKVTDNDYKNKSKRDRVINEIKETLINEFPIAETQCLTVGDIKSKIHTVRTQFMKEFKKVKDTHKTGAGADEVYVPKLWCYDLLFFLADVDVPVASTSNLDLSATQASQQGEQGDIEDEESFSSQRTMVFEGTVEELNASKRLKRYTDHGDTNTSEENINENLSHEQNTKKTSGKSLQTSVANLLNTAVSVLKTKDNKENDDDLHRFCWSLESEMRKVKNKRKLRMLKCEFFTKVLEAQSDSDDE